MKRITETRADALILAFLQRASDDDDIATQIATKVQDAITSAADAHVGLLRHLARILTAAAMEAEGGGAAIVQAVVALRDAGLTYEPRQRSVPRVT